MLAAMLVAATRLGRAGDGRGPALDGHGRCQTGSLNAGTPGSVTYDLVLTRNSSYPSNSSVLNWSVASLPAGATATFVGRSVAGTAPPVPRR